MELKGHENKIVQTFNSLVRNHDWYYMMSDDRSYWVKGGDERRELKKIARKLVAMGLREEAEEIWFEYAPNRPMTSIQFSFPA
tara:strand:- start:16136 stop:16384 length:249 start_codon:yes stop_codon:yes gene_type:complete